jgi:uncharacterized protein (TIGR02722 family)
MKKTIIIALFGALFFFSCGGGATQYRDATKDRGSATWGPKEIKSTVNKMVTSLYAYLKEDWGKPVIIENKPIRNRTSEHIDTEIVSNEIVTNLMQKRINFIDSSMTAAAIEEMGRGMTGLIDPESAVPMGELKSPNFYLYGEISDNVRFVGKKQLQYIVVTLKLTELRTGMVRWQDQKEFLKSSATTKISF